MKKRSPIVTDGLQNVLAKIGVGKGKGGATHYVDVPRLALELRAAYENAWLPAKVVDIPARDALRQWRRWEQDADAAKAEEDRIGLRRKTLQAETAARLYGGAAIFVDTGSETPDVQWQDGEEIERLVVVSQEQVMWPAQPATPFERMDAIFTVAGRRVHTSRLALFLGVPPVGTDYGWGQSVLKRAWDALLNADSVPQAVAELVWEAKVDVYKIKGFMQGLADPGYEQKIIQRFRLANIGKSLVNGLVLDSEEDYQQKQVGFGDLANLILVAYQVAAGAADIPVTRLIGRSASGLNASGDNEVRDYYDSIRSIQTLQIAPALAEIDRHIALKTGQDVAYEWNSLWQPTVPERANTLKTISDSVAGLVNSHLFPADVLYQPVVQMLAEVLPGIDVAAEEFAAGADDEDQ